MLSPVISGAPALVDIATANRAATCDFYSGLFGWTYSSAGDYVYAELDGDVVAGVRDGEQAAWTLYVHADAVETAAKSIEEAGGQIVFGPYQDPGQGEALVAADPAGAVFGLWRADVPGGFGVGRPGTLTWAELRTIDGGRIDAFYGRLFGYEQRQIGDGRHFDYTVWSAGGQTRLGRHADKSYVLPYWLVYFAVDPAVGTDATVVRVTDLGGSVIGDPLDVSTGRMGLVADVSGAVFALIDETGPRAS
ncbi:VOC family protein [Nonomuraea sp. NPDC050547]|uniref:VOC family protein n=1 Tax=unclassified Nonomuraea TaxID=2593643 RepID=UPI0037A7ED24